MSWPPRKPRTRRRWPFPVIGLTGSIAMGKSTAAQLLRRVGVSVIDSDEDGRRLMNRGGAAVPAIRRRFPDTVDSTGAVNRKILGPRVFADYAALTDLENILHPLIRAARDRQLRALGRRRSALAVIDVPLLFETGVEAVCDAVMVVSAPAFLQRQRALARPGMTPARLAQVLARQMPDAEKRRRADVVIPSSLGRRETLNRIKRFLARLQSRRIRSILA